MSLWVYVGMTTRQFEKRIKEHVPKSIDESCKMSNKENKSVRVVNASKRPAIAEHLISKSNFAVIIIVIVLKY